MAAHPKRELLDALTEGTFSTCDPPELNYDNDNVYWTKAGNKYHIFEDCQHIKDRDVINNGTVKDSWEQKGISELRKTCEKRARSERNLLE